MYNPFTLEGKTILITGASSGIGQATAIECSKLGATVVASGRNEQRLQETFSSLDFSYSQKHMQILADLTDDESLSNLVNLIVPIDGLVNNAGVNKVKPISFIKQEDFNYVFQTNTFSGIHLLRLLSKKKKLNRNCSIVFTSSVSAFYNASGRALYASSKAALTSLMRSVALEFSEKGIRANAVHPGMIDSKMMHEVLSGEDIEKDLLNYPLKRYGKPNDVAWAIVYLLSDASSWMTGSSIVIDGGFMLK